MGSGGEAGYGEDVSEGRDGVKAGVRRCASVDDDSEAKLEESDQQKREGDGPESGGRIISIFATLSLSCGTCCKLHYRSDDLETEID